jgi:hypothetical protein
VWNKDNNNTSIDEIKWPFEVFNETKSYGENLRLIDKKFFDDIDDNFNIDQYMRLNKKAIVYKTTDIRALPTKKPIFKDPKQAGEGYPFDYLQNSLIEANKPVVVSHYSKDREWVFILSSFTYGWIESDKIVFLEDFDDWKNKEHIYIIKDNCPIYDNSGNFLYKSRIGMYIPIVGEDEKNYVALYANLYNATKIQKINIPKDIASKKPIDFNKTNLDSIIKQISSSNYGWGGLYDQRDCSSTLRDIFIPFGLWLPRNSSKQALVGDILDLSNLSNNEKLNLIKSEAIPFKTLLYKKGHILLYIGTFKNEVVVYHNVWGIKTIKNNQEGRIVIGQPVISTLNLGSHQESYNEKESLLSKLKSLNILF